MHYANPEKSKRLSRLLTLLRATRRSGVTTSEIQSWTNSNAPATDISELRCSGHVIPPAEYERTTNAGRKVYRYRYAGRDPVLSGIADIRRIARRKGK